MRSFDSPFGRATLTNERKRHILTFHPDVARFMRYLNETLASPERIVKSKHDPNVVICYRFLAKHKRWLAVVVKTSHPPFILTAYLAKKPKRDTM